MEQILRERYHRSPELALVVLQCHISREFMQFALDLAYP